MWGSSSANNCRATWIFSTKPSALIRPFAFWLELIRAQQDETASCWIFIGWSGVRALLRHSSVRLCCEIRIRAGMLKQRLCWTVRTVACSSEIFKNQSETLYSKTRFLCTHQWNVGRDRIDSLRYLSLLGFGLGRPCGRRSFWPDQAKIVMPGLVASICLYAIRNHKLL